jgi:hypothetical protein
MLPFYLRFKRSKRLETSVEQAQFAGSNGLYQCPANQARPGRFYFLSRTHADGHEEEEARRPIRCNQKML